MRARHQISKEGNKMASTTVGKLTSKQAEQGFKEALALFNSGEHGKSLKQLDPIIESIPDHTEALHLKGSIEYLQENYEQAEQLLDKAIAIEPAQPYYLYNRGLVHISQGQIEKAEDLFLSALKLCPQESKIQYMLGEICRIKGQSHKAYLIYRTLVRAGKVDDNLTYGLFECLRSIHVNSFDKAVEQDIIKYFNFKNVDFNHASRFIASHFIEKYNLSSEQPEINVEEIASDPLFNTFLQKTIITEPHIEVLLVQLRKHLLFQYSNHSSFTEPLSHLCNSIGIQSHNNEYVHYYEQNEEQIVDSFISLIELELKKTNPDLEILAQYLSIIAMYVPIFQAPFYNQLKSIKRDQWPTLYGALLNETLFERELEDWKQNEIQSVSKIENPTSTKVKEQYEENPYPRWISFNYRKPLPLSSVLQQSLSGFKVPQFITNREVNILVAGCGTGRHAISIAKNYKDVRVTAIDISKKSLSYAIRKADEYKIKNLEFYQGDILSLQGFENQFEIIECAGVLHHLKEPEEGLRVLLKCLIDGGLMKLGLYSGKAREHISLLRDLTKDLDKSSQPDFIREVRYSVLTGQISNDLTKVLDTTDFYSMSGCRDLLFHFQEHCFDTSMIKDWCQSYDLNFLGFDSLKRGVLQSYQALFPNDPHARDLSTWAEFEERYPNTFDNMYQFWVQKTDNR